MMKNFLTALCLLLISFAHAQLPETLQKYYDYTDKAEFAIVTDNKKAASDYYQNAFAIKKEPFLDDIYNSFIVNLQVQNNERAKQDYKRLRCLGYNFPIRIYDFFKKFEKENKDFIDATDCSKQQEKFSYQLKKTLDSLAKSDQAYGRFTSLDFEASSKRPDKELIKKLNTNDSLNAIKLKEVIEKYGFPSEYITGLNNQHDAFSPNYTLVIVHQQKKGKDIDVDFTPLLYKAVLEGKLRNKNFVNIIEFATLKKDYNLPLTKVNGEFHISKNIYPENRNEEDKKEIMRIEDNRKKIGLPDLSKTLLYKLYMNRNDMFYRFEPSRPINFFSASSDEKFVNELTANTITVNFEDYFKRYLNDKNNNGK